MSHIIRINASLSDDGPLGVKYFILDTPAGIGDMHLNELIRTVDTILVLVLFFLFDIRITVNFIYDIFSGDVFDIRKQKFSRDCQMSQDKIQSVLKPQ